MRHRGPRIRSLRPVTTWMRELVCKRIWRSLKTGSALVGGLIAFAAATAGVIQYWQSNPAADVSGTWELSLTIEETSYSPYRGMILGYLLFLQQNGASVTGRGEKWAANGEELPSSQHDRIDLRGTISGTNLDLVFNIYGTQRQTVGVIRLGLVDDSEAMGDFTWTAASSSGTAIGVRQMSSPSDPQQRRHGNSLWRSTAR